MIPAKRSILRLPFVAAGGCRSGEWMSFQELKPLTIGGVTKAELLWQLGLQGVSLNEYARVLFADPVFAPAKEECQVRPVVVSLPDLGLTDGGTFDEIVQRAGSAGLTPCPTELGPHLRLRYRDQPEGPYLTVASQKLRGEDAFPNGLYLRRLEDGLWLRGYNAGPENIYAPDFTDFVFLRSGAA